MGTEPLELRTNAVLEALKRARAAVPGVAELDAGLGGRFEGRFKQLAGEVEAGLVNGVDAKESAKLLKQGEDLVAETLAFLGGAAARKYKLDRGVTALADAWLDQLGKTPGLQPVGVVIPASTEFTGMLTHIVRLRLPSDGIWSLPVAVHEYGHFVASVFVVREVRDGMAESFVPVEELAHGAANRNELPKLYWHGHELFADALAAATAGPAYTRYCVHYRFDPVTARKDTPSHPEPARRIRLQLRVLEKLAQKQGAYLEAEADAIRKTWKAALDAVGVAVDPRPDELLDPLEDKLIAVLDEPPLKAIRYGDHGDAKALAIDLLDENSTTDSVAIALNAAWARRLGKNPPALDDIASACERLVREALARG